jgi:hypothetical protein
MGGLHNMAMTIRKAMRIAKQVKLGLASGADGKTVYMSPEERDKAYRAAIRKQGRTVSERDETYTLDTHTLKAIGLIK